VLVAAAAAYALQQMMVYPALPELGRQFDASPTRVAWVVTSFLLGAAALTPVAGRLGDQYGKPRVLLAVLLVFLVGSLGAAVAPDIWSLIAFRAVAGCGMAIFPLSYGIVRDEFPRDRVKLGIGTLSSVLGFGGGFGAVVSGAVIDNLSWRWLFVIGAVPVAVAALLVWRFIPKAPVRAPAGRIDFAGIALLAGSLLALLTAISEAGRLGWTSTPIVALFVLAAVLGGSLVVVERRRTYALLDMRVMGSRPMLLGSLASMAVGFTYFSSFVLVPQLVEIHPPPHASGTYVGFGASATAAGLYLVPSSVMMLVCGPLAGIFGRRFGSRISLAAGLGLASAGATELAIWHASLPAVVVGITALGGGIGMSLASLAGLMIELAPPTQTGIVNGMNAVLRTVGGALGGQIAAALLASAVVAGQTVPTERGFRDAFWMAAAASAVGAILAFFARPAPASRGGEAPALEA
jgi:MFS family permease